MINHAWTVVCEKSIIDKETNNISLDVLEQMAIRTLPFPADVKGIIFPVQMEIISLWYRGLSEDGAKGHARLRIIMPNNEEVSVTNIDIDLITSHRQRTRSRLNGLPVPKNVSGYFYFIVEMELDHNWVEVSRIPLEVKLEETHTSDPQVSTH